MALYKDYTLRREESIIFIVSHIIRLSLTVNCHRSQAKQFFMMSA
jgi:hypothetical protein